MDVGGGTDLLSFVLEHIHTVNEWDYDKDTVLNIIFTDKARIPVGVDVIAALLENALPFDRSTFEQVEESVHKFGWVHGVQQEDQNVVDAVGLVLDRFQERALDLAKAEDEKGRRCLDIASPACKIKILKKLYLHERYDLKPGPAEHRSATSMVIFFLLTTEKHSTISTLTEITWCVALPTVYSKWP